MLYRKGRKLEGPETLTYIAYMEGGREGEGLGAGRKMNVKRVNGTGEEGMS